MNNITPEKSKTPNWALHLAGSLALTAILIMVIEILVPYSVAPFINYRLLLWIAGISVLIALILPWIRKPASPSKGLSDPSKSSGNRLA